MIPTRGFAVILACTSQAGSLTANGSAEVLRSTMEAAMWASDFSSTSISSLKTGMRAGDPAELELVVVGMTVADVKNGPHQLAWLPYLHGADHEEPASAYLRSALVHIDEGSRVLLRDLDWDGHWSGEHQ
jgi:hypothetical protein